MALIENTIQKSNSIVTAKIIAVSNKMITFLTETGQHFLIPLTNKERQDNLFLATMKDIWHAGLWIPVNQKMHQLLEYDWLAQPATVTA